MLETIHIRNSENPSRVLIFLHGLGSNAENLRGLATTFAQKFPHDLEIILPQAPMQNVSLAAGVSMPAWFDIYEIRRGSKEDTPGIIKAKQNIQQLIQTLNERQIANRNIAIGGFSQGGALALYFTGHSHETYAAGIGLSCYLPLGKTLKKNLPKLLRSTPVFIGHGVDDAVVPLDFNETARDLLLEAGFSVTWHTYPLGHTIDESIINDVIVWLQSKLF